ncbi:MAG: 5'-nucleotidase C-terminal domain-containing protein [Flavobacteriaceae bacterium]
MKKILFTIAAIALVFNSCKTKDSVTSTVKDDGIITFKFIQLNDVYEIAPLSGGLYGGMARVAHVADSIKKAEPNSFMVMAGDFLSPSLLGTMRHDGKRIMGKQMIEVMNAMNFDLVTFGNHEFDLKEEEFQNRLNESNFQWISTNVKQQIDGEAIAFSIARNGNSKPLQETYRLLISDADGTEAVLGFFGVTLDSNPQPYVVYEDYLESVQRVYPELKENSDIIVGLTHLGLSQDKKLAETLPGISLLMGGHEHHSMLLDAGNAKIAKADANAKTIYVHTLTFYKNQNRLMIDSELVPIDEKVPSQRLVQEIVEDWNVILETEIKKVVDDPYEQIYFANTPLDGTDSASRGIQTNLGGFIAEAMAASFNYEVDGALVNGGSIRIDDELKNEITPVDIFRVLPFGGGVLKVELKGSLLTEVLDYGKQARGTGAYLQRYNFSQNEKGEWLIAENQIDPNKTYTIAFSDFLLKGFDIPFLTPENDRVLSVYKPTEEETGYDIRKALIAFMKRLK